MAATASQRSATWFATLELKANLECEAFGLAPRTPAVVPDIIHGIEINPLAAELARTTIWIGDIQWRIRNGIYARPEPILRKLDSIDCRDALFNEGCEGSFTEASWPDAEFIVGNPPFLGDKLMIAALGENYVATLRSLFAGRVLGGADHVAYWFDKSRLMLAEQRSRRVGLVATNTGLVVIERDDDITVSIFTFTIP